MSIDYRIIQSSGQPRQLRRVDHPDGDGGSVAPLETLRELDRVAERMSVVQYLAQPRLLEVAPHDARLDTDRQFDQAPKLVARGVRRAIHVPFDDVENLGLGDEAVFDHLAEASEDLHLAESAQGVEVDDDGGGSVESADHVLALRGVDAGLAPDRGVDHAQQRRGHLDERHTSQPGRGDEPCEVGDCPPAETDHGVGSGEIALPHHAPTESRHFDPFGGLRIRNLRHQHLEPLEEALPQTGGRGPEGRRVHDEDLVHGRRQRITDRREDAAADDNVVGVDPVHGDAGACHTCACSVSGRIHSATSNAMSSIGRDEVSQLRVARRS